MSEINNWPLGSYCPTCSLLLKPGSTDHTCIGMEKAKYREPNYFAHKIFDSSGKEVYHPSRRDYFAAAALQGYLASNFHLSNSDSSAMLIVRAADYIIAALDKEK